jgi:hypothetical protein
MREWLRGWLETWKIRLYTPEVYEALKDKSWELDEDFVEVQPPGECGTGWPG